MKIRNRSSKSFRTKGFTIMEMVVVLAIISIILLLAVRGLGGVLDMGKETQAKADMNTLTSNLLQYKMRAGHYPSQAQGLKALVEQPTSAPKPRRWVKIEGAPLMDPWDNEYVYKYPGTKNKNEPEIISKGPDGVLGNGDDFSSQDQ